MSSIAVVKAVMGYQAANERPSCGDCKHGEEQFADRSPPYDAAGWRCVKGGFKTSVKACCKQHEPAKPGART